MRMTLFLLVSMLSMRAPVRAETGVTAAEILVGSCVDLAASAKVQSGELVMGAKAYFNSINDAGGIHGRKIRQEVFNDSYEPEQAIECFNRLQKAGAFALVLSYGSPTGAKYAPMAESNKVPYFPGGAGPYFFYEPVNPYLFVVRASFDDEGRQMVDHLWSDLNFRKFGAIYQDDAGGAMILRGVRMGLEKHGASMVAQASFKRNTEDVDEAMRQVRAAKPEVVFLLGPYKPHAEVLKRAQASGWKPLFVAVGPRDPLVKAAGPASEGAIISQIVPPPDRSDLRTVALYRKLLKKYYPEAKPNYYSLEGFLVAMVFAEGLKIAGRDLTREKLVQSLESIRDWDIGLGSDVKVSFGKQKHGALDKIFFTVARDGKLVVFDDWSKLKR